MQHARSLFSFSCKSPVKEKRIPIRIRTLATVKCPTKCNPVCSNKLSKKTRVSFLSNINDLNL